MQHFKINVQKTSNFRVIDPKMPVRIYQGSKDKAGSVEPLTVPALMNKTVTAYPNRNGLMYKDEGSDEWKAITYKEYQNRVEKMAKVFIKLGLERHGTVAVLAFNSVEWFISDLATIHAGLFHYYSV